MSIPLWAATPNIEGKTDRPLRYKPDGRDFVIENGPELFNRPLYGGNTAFRVDAGDKPEFSLYLPGRGGNVRLGIKVATSTKWLNDASQIISRYRPGSMQYEIRDPILGSGIIRIAAIASHEVDALLLHLTATGTPDAAELLVAFGGANGERGRRGGDIGAESVPVSQFFALKSDYCRDNRFEIDGNRFTLTSRPGRIAGTLPQRATLAVADSRRWDSAEQLLASAGQSGDLPVVVGRVPIRADQPVHISIQVLRDGGELLADLSRSFDRAEQHFQKIAAQVVVETPDPFINAAAAALCVASDALWDEPGSAYMHGAVAWRSKLLGWRGPYTGDALGWHDRTRRHVGNWTTRQSTRPTTQTSADEGANLARSEAWLHSDGDMTNSHYDMNMVAIDAIFRHLLWTGDIEYARLVWPVIKRHLAWEKRLFRREFGPDGNKLPLYEAYACIWASDDLQYGGGGVTHSSAYNYWHNAMAARLAEMLGEDPAPYRDEANLILKGMNRELWLSDRGWFAEFKDILGNQLVHPAAAVWTHYHTIDSHAADPLQAWQMSRYIDTQIPHIPIRGPNVPEGTHEMASSRWMPYTWSINNVAMAETVHTALSHWQTGRADAAFALFKGSILDSMYMGLCPGNVHMASYFDAYRRESQRDSADPIGITSRTLIEGLFGISPDALAGELLIRPGFPKDWDHASIKHPDLSYSYKRDGSTDSFEIDSRFQRPMRLRLRLAARSQALAEVLVNGTSVEWQNIEDSVGAPSIEISSPPAPQWRVQVTWEGAMPLATTVHTAVAAGEVLNFDLAPAALLDVSDPQGAWNAVQRGTSSIRAKASGMAGHRTTFAKVRQGSLTWWHPISFEIRAKERPGTSARAAEAAKWETLDLSQKFNDRVTRIFQNEYLSPRSPYCSLSLPKHGLGGWATMSRQAEIDDRGLRARSDANGGRVVLPGGVVFATPGKGDAKNIAFVSQWDNYPRELAMPLSGRASRVYLLMAGSTNHMQSWVDNGEVVVTYADGSADRLPLVNPTNWWPIEQDYFIDDFQFAHPGPLPPRLDLKTGELRILDQEKFKGQGGRIAGGAATVLDLPLDPQKELRTLTVRAIANEVVIGLMGATLARE